MDGEKKTFICRVMYGVIFLTASIPLVCGYIMEGGENLVWIKRIEEAAEGGGIYALNSNFWLLIPALIRALGGSMTAAYLIFMLLINSVTLYSSYKMFGRLFEDKFAAMYGVLLFMAGPYRIWLCYDQGDLGKAAAWMLVPLFLWGMQGIFSGARKWKEILTAAVALGGIGYGDSVMFLTAAGCAIAGILWYRKPMGLLPVFTGVVLYLPGEVYLMRYLIRGGMEEWYPPVQSIMGEGYVFGQFFTSFIYQDGRPGLGMGLFGALLALMWLMFVGDGGKIMKKYGFYVVMALLFLGMSLSCFPWDFIQRISVIFLRLVSLFGTPGIFFGWACLFLCVPAAYGVERLFRQEEKFVRIGIPLMILIASIGTAVYLCNALTFTRLPLG